MSKEFLIMICQNNDLASSHDSSGVSEIDLEFFRVVKRHFSEQ
jgi:hypothetical protein